MYVVPIKCPYSEDLILPNLIILNGLINLTKTIKGIKKIDTKILKDIKKYFFKRKYIFFTET